MTAPSRGWSRFGLRTLFVVVTVVCLVIAFFVRATLLWSHSRFHEHRADEVGDQFYFRAPVDELLTIRQGREKEVSAAYRELHQWHKEMAAKYRLSIWRPGLELGSSPPQPPDPESQLPWVKH